MKKILLVFTVLIICMAARRSMAACGDLSILGITTHPLCYGDANGSIDVIVAGGTLPYTFLWNDGSITEDIINLSSGTFILTVTDGVGCIAVDSFNIVDPFPFYISGVISHVSCYGTNDGTINTTPYGGTPPYNFVWAPNGESTEDLWNLPGGICTLFVADAHGCQAVSIYVVNEPQPLVADVIGTNVQCFGTNTGSLVVLPSGGTTPYEYLWNDFYMDSSRSGVAAGRYVVLVTDLNGCHTYDSIYIIEPTEITITGVITDVLCNGFYTGAIDITETGGTAFYSYSWSPNGETTQDISSLLAGTYSVTVTDANACNQTATFVVKESLILYTTTSVSNPTCFGGNNGFISVDVSGGTIPYTYYWSTTPPAYGATATNLSEGTYSLTVSDANNCSATASAIVINPQPIMIAANPTPAQCFNTATGIATITVTGGTRPYVYQLNGIIQADSTFDNLLDGAYIVAVRDANGCEGTESFYIASPSPFTVALDAPQNVINQGMSTQLVAITSSPDSNIVQYIWDPLFGWDPSIQGDTIIFDFSGCLDTLMCPNPYVSPRITTLFTVAVMNQDGCYGYDTVTVYVDQPLSLVPTAFTPYSISLYPNPASDQLFIETNGMAITELNIYNSIGSLVSQTKQPANNRIDISNLAMGVYIAEIKVRDAVQRVRWVKM